MTNSKIEGKLVVPATRPSKRRSTVGLDIKNHDRIKVHHDYHDLSREPRPTSSECNAHSLKSGSVNPPFPNKLYEMLMNAEEDGISHIISFAQHGRAIQVHEPKLLVELLPRYFTLSKIASFQRQLNLYGFNRLTKGADRGCYYHELFLRGHPWLLERMHRVKVKGTFVRARSNPDQEPDFWSMPWVGVEEDQSGATSVAPLTSPLVRLVKPITASTQQRTTASVVSQDDEDEDKDDPIYCKSASFQDEPFRCIVSHESDAVLTTWGMPFHSLSTSDWDDDQSLAKTLEDLLHDDECSFDLETCDVWQDFAV